MNMIQSLHSSKEEKNLDLEECNFYNRNHHPFLITRHRKLLVKYNTRMLLNIIYNHKFMLNSESQRHFY